MAVLTSDAVSFAMTCVPSRAGCAPPLGPVQGAPDLGFGPRATPMEHSITDIRYDDDYAKFYMEYSAQTQRKMPPPLPLESRQLIHELMSHQNRLNNQQLLNAAGLGGTQQSVGRAPGRTRRVQLTALQIRAPAQSRHSRPLSRALYLAGLEVIDEQGPANVGGLPDSMLQALSQLSKCRPQHAAF